MANAEKETTQAKASGSFQALKMRELTLKCDRLKFKLEQERKSWVLKSDVAASIRRALGGVAGLCEAKLCNEYPGIVAGLDPAAARSLGRKLYDMLMSECQKLAQEFPE
jgi:hypothetical protein